MDKNFELISLGVCVYVYIYYYEKCKHSLCVFVCNVYFELHKNQYVTLAQQCSLLSDITKTKRILQTCFKSEQKTNHNSFDGCVGFVVVVAKERHYRRPHRIVEQYNSYDLNWKAEGFWKFPRLFYSGSTKAKILVNEFVVVICSMFHQHHV